MRINRADNKGAAMVEFAIVALLLVTLVFGIIEFGLLIKDYLTLSQAAREGARSAALRSGVSTVTERVQQSAVGLPEEQRDDITVTPSYRVFTSGSGWGAWIDNALPDPSADVEAQVKVKATYYHQTIVGSLVGLGSSVKLSGDMVMRRE